MRVSRLGHCAQTLDKLVNFDEVLSIRVLQGGPRELSVRKSYLQRLKGELGLYCNIELDYDSIGPNAKEVEEMGYETAKTLRTVTFCDRIERMKYEIWLKAAASYSDLTMGDEEEIATSDEGEMVILDNEEEHGKGNVTESDQNLQGYFVRFEFLASNLLLRATKIDKKKFVDGSLIDSSVMSVLSWYFAICSYSSSRLNCPLHPHYTIHFKPLQNAQFRSDS